MGIKYRTMKFASKETEQDQDKYKRAKKRIEELKGFYGHLSVYLLVNAGILAAIYISARNDGESFWQAGHFFTLIFWGIGLVFHAAYTFNINLFFGKKWEERQIRKYIEKDKEESQKYK
jgi:hypothetical protein